MEEGGGRWSLFLIAVFLVGGSYSAVGNSSMNVNTGIRGAQNNLQSVPSAMYAQRNIGRSGLCVTDEAKGYCFS